MSATTEIPEGHLLSVPTSMGLASERPAQKTVFEAKRECTAHLEYRIAIDNVSFNLPKLSRSL